MPHANNFVTYLQISIEGVLGLQIIGVDNISLRPGLCKYIFISVFVTEIYVCMYAKWMLMS